MKFDVNHKSAKELKARLKSTLGAATWIGGARSQGP